jgi:hypothetical protein
MNPGFYAGFLVFQRDLAANILAKMYEWAKKWHSLVPPVYEFFQKL